MLFLVLFFVALNSVFTISVTIKNARLKLSLAIPIGAPIRVAIEMLPVVADATFNDFQNSEKIQCIY